MVLRVFLLIEPHANSAVVKAWGRCYSHSKRVVGSFSRVRSPSGRLLVRWTQLLLSHPLPRHCGTLEVTSKLDPPQLLGLTSNQLFNLRVEDSTQITSQIINTPCYGYIRRLRDWSRPFASSVRKMDVQLLREPKGGARVMPCCLLVPAPLIWTIPHWCTNAPSLVSLCISILVLSSRVVACCTQKSQ
jgi:hypothetical protein